MPFGGSAWPGSSSRFAVGKPRPWPRLSPPTTVPDRANGRPSSRAASRRSPAATVSSTLICQLPVGRSHASQPAENIARSPGLRGGVEPVEHLARSEHPPRIRLVDLERADLEATEAGAVSAELGSDGPDVGAGGDVQVE